jgi:phosphoglycerol transferase MdoB-like AlkP superfamily enzyme
MPNMDRFYQESLVFDNYYNHTAATFRGLRGQLTSSFIGAREDGERGLAFVNSGELVDHSHRETVISVPQILKSRGYDTAFLTPHSTEMNLNTFIKDIGFDQVITGTEVAGLQGHDQVPVGDKNLYRFLPDLTSKLKQPYFLGVYNFGTHLFQDSPDEKYGDGSSVVLNRFHNVDTQFGLFLEKFKTDPQFKNTVLILTADHAAYPAPEFTEVEDVKAGYFIDRIPMMVYWNGVEHQKIDLAGRNSLSFAPTIMEMAKIKDAKNYFLGCSMFSDGCDITSYVTNVNAFYFMTNTGQIRYLTEDKADPDYTTARKAVERFIQYSGF